MPVVIIPKSPQQKSSKFAITPVSTSSQPTIWYTCPANKIATVRGFVALTEFGASTRGNFERITVDLAEWELVGCDPSNNNPFSLCRDRPYFFDITLNATDFIRTTQNSGDNATFQMIAEVTELPA